MSSIKASSFYGKKSTAHDNVQVVFVPDFDKSECSGVETESDYHQLALCTHQLLKQNQKV